MKRLPMILVTAAMTLAACGGTSTAPTSSSGGPSKVASIAAEVPDSIKSLAPLQIATDATYPPNESINPDTGAIEGWDIDFGKALAGSHQVHACFSDYLVQYVAGRDTVPADAAVVDRLAMRSFAGASARDLLISSLESDLVRYPLVITESR